MILKNTGKMLATAVATLWLAGCASYGPLGGGSGNAGDNRHADSSFGSDTTQGIDDPAVSAVIREGEINGSPDHVHKLLSQNTYYFKFDSNAINPDDYDSLKAQAALMKTPEYRDVTLVIEGNTDQRGTRNYNMALGLRRADAVRDYLVASGVNSKKVRVISYGFEKPVDPENNPVAWAKNRRAHLVFQNGNDKPVF